MSCMFIGSCNDKVSKAFFKHFCKSKLRFPEMTPDGREGSYFVMCTECGYLMVT